MLIKIQCYIIARWPVSGIKSSAGQDPMLYNIMLTRSLAIKSPADQNHVLYNSILARFFWYFCRVLIMFQCYITACWRGSSFIKSPADQDPMLNNNMLARFFRYKVAC